MEFILKLKHWQIILFILFAGIVANFELTFNGEPQYYHNIIGIILYSLYPFSVGYFLPSYLPRRIELNYNLFLINGFLWITIYVITTIISEGKGWSVSGFAAIPFLYLFYAVLHFYAFPVKTLNSIEKGKEVPVGSYVKDFFLLLFLPIGIWFLQPRINAVVKNYQDEE